MKGIRVEVLLATLSGFVVLSLLGAPVSTAAIGATVVVLVRFFGARRWPDGLWNLFLFLSFTVIGLWVGGIGSRVPAGLGLALLVLHVQRLWQCRSANDEKVLLVLPLLSLILVGSQTTSALFLVAFVMWLTACPLVLMGTSGGARLKIGVFGLVWLIAVLLFIGLPRFQSPAMEPGQPQDAVIGFTDEISLGDLGTLIEDDTPVLRVHLDETQSGPMYFRGVSMDLFDGAIWRRTAKRTESTLPEGSEEGLSRVEVLSEPGTRGVLFTVGDVARVTVSHGTPWRDEDGNWFVDGPEGSKRYQLWTDLQRFERVDAVQARWKQWPNSTSPRLLELARNVVADAETSSEKMDRMVDWISENMDYTRSPRDAAPEDPVETFLFEKKEGHCEYFASALAIMLRTQGVPTRVVNGFLGGEYNPQGGYWVVRQAHAHAWVEALDETNTWRRLDATPQEVAPPVLLNPTAQWMETLNWWWTNQVVAYDRRAQWQLAQAPIWTVQSLLSGGEDAGDESGFPWMGIFVCVAGLVWGLLGVRNLWRRQRARWLGQMKVRSGIARLHDRAWNILAERGWRPPEGLPRLQAATWMVETIGPEAEPLRQLVWLHYRVKFGGESEDALHAEAVEWMGQVMTTFTEQKRSA